MKRIFILASLAAVILAACSPATSPGIAGVWELVSYGDPASLMPAVADVDTSIEFKSDGTLSGNVGCNGFGGDYTESDTAIEFGALISTLMACIGQVGEQESAVFQVFTGSATFTLEGDRLTITSGDGDSAVVLVRK